MFISASHVLLCPCLCTNLTYVRFGSFNLETPENSSGNIRFGWLPKSWSRTADETITACSIGWGGDTNYTSLDLQINNVLSSPTSVLLNYLNLVYVAIISANMLVSVLYLGHISNASTTSFLVTGWSTKKCCFYFASRIQCHKHGFSSFSPYIAPRYGVLSSCWAYGCSFSQLTTSK